MDVGSKDMKNVKVTKDDVYQLAKAKLSNTELIDLARLLRKFVEGQNRQNARVGSRVAFTLRDGTTLTGTVSKVMLKNIKIEVDPTTESARYGSGVWSVSPSLLTVL